MMWYVTDKDQHMDPRCFGDLSLLLKTIMENDEKGIIRYINERMDPDSAVTYNFTVPYIGDKINLGELTVSWAKFSGKWNELIWLIADSLQEEVLDCFESLQSGDTEIVYVGNYAITHD